jgi:hypothetical protein
VKIQVAKEIHKLIVDELVKHDLVPDDIHFKEVNVKVTPKNLSVNVDYEELDLNIRNI